MTTLFSFIAVIVVLSVVVVAYYLRPSRGQHGNPHGAAATVESLQPRDQPSWPSYGLFCGYEPSEPDERPVVAARPYLDHADYRRAAVASLAANETTAILSTLVDAT